MHLAARGYFLIALTALLAISSTWSSDPSTAWSWALPAGLLLTGLAFEAWWQPKLQLHARITFARRLLLGRAATAKLEIRHSAGRALRFQYVRILPEAFALDDSLRELSLPAEGVAHEAWPLQPVRLGPGAFGPLAARVLGRFGFAWWSASIPLDAEFAVAPDTRGGARRRIAGSARGDTPQRAAGAGGELFQLRAYVPGDPLTRIDWKASARARELIAREMSEDQHLEIMVIVDAGRMSRVRAGELDRLALYANVAARFAEYAVQADDRVGLVAYADRALATVPPSRGLLGVSRVRDALERLRSERGESCPVAAAAALRCILRRRSLIVWLCDFADPDVAAELLRVVRALGARHFVVVAGVEPRAIEAWQSREARGWRDPPIAIAATERANAVAAQAARLRERGAIVVSASEAGLEAAVIGVYERERRRRRA